MIDFICRTCVCIILMLIGVLLHQHYISQEAQQMKEKELSLQDFVYNEFIFNRGIAPTQQELDEEAAALIDYLNDISQEIGEEYNGYDM